MVDFMKISHSQYLDINPSAWHTCKKKKTLCNQHNIHNLRVVEALLFLGIYGKSKNSQYFGKKLKIWGGGGGGKIW